jgi:L-fucose isomerase
MNNWGVNHCVMSHGHIGADLVSLGSFLRIPVYMFRACANFGPLYR